MKPVDQLTLVEVIQEMDGLVPFDDQIYAVRDRAAEDMGECPSEMSTWDHPAVVRYGELCVRVKQLMAGEPEPRRDLVCPLIARGDPPPGVPTKEVAIDARIPLRIVQSIPVTGLDHEVFVHNVAELNDHVSEDSPWYGGAVDFFLGGGGELRLYPPLSDGDG